MKDWFESLINTNFMPHGHCYLWRPDILWTHVLSDLIIALSYFAIPVVLGIFLIKQRKAILYPEVFALFSAFIFFCGLTHLVAIYVTWYPAYELQGWLKALTALVSLATAVVLVPKLPTLITLPSIQSDLRKSQEALAAIKQEKAEMEAIFEAAHNREAQIIQLKEEVNEVLQTQGLPPKYLQG